VPGGAGVEHVHAAAVLPQAAAQESVDEGGQVGGAVHDGGVDDLAAAARPRLQEGGQDADHEVHAAAREVAEQVHRDLRGAAGAADGVQGAGDGDVADVVPGGVGQGALLPPAGHPPVDELRVAGEAVVRADAEPLGDAGPAALDRKSTRLNSSHVKRSYAVFC